MKIEYVIQAASTIMTLWNWAFSKGLTMPCGYWSKWKKLKAHSAIGL
jgi:hypothetical protein